MSQVKVQQAEELPTPKAALSAVLELHSCIFGTVNVNILPQRPAAHNSTVENELEKVVHLDH